MRQQQSEDIRGQKSSLSSKEAEELDDSSRPWHKLLQRTGRGHARELLEHSMESTVTDECRAEAKHRRESSAQAMQRDDGKPAKLQRSEEHERRYSEGGKRNVMLEVQQVVPMAPSSASSSKRSHGEKTCRKRWRSNGYGDKSKASSRPIERQQILQRLLELRHIVPCSTNCSIDSLLERTMDYINFLQSRISNG